MKERYVDISMVSTPILPSMASFHVYAKKEEIEGEANHNEDYCSLTYQRRFSPIQF